MSTTFFLFGFLSCKYCMGSSFHSVCILHATSLWEFICVLNFLPPLHDLLHFSQVITLSSCSFCMCNLRCFFSESFKTAYDTRKHGDCRFVLLAMMWYLSNVIICPYQKENILCRKWYVLNLVCFGSGTATFDERGTIESEIEERCTFLQSSRPHQKFRVQ